MSAVPSPSPDLEYRRLLPTPGSVTVPELLGLLKLSRLAPAERPYTIVNFIASVDGRAAFHGRSGAFGDPGDRAMFHGLRECADAVFAGTGTLRSERYGRLVRDPRRRQRRAASGLAPDPLACLLTRSGDVPQDIPLFDDPSSRIVVFAPRALEFPAAAAAVETVVLDPGELTLTTMLRRLRSAYGVQMLLCEGGPRVFAAMLRERLVDELFLTVAPRLAGGGGDPPITKGPELAELSALKLLWALERDGYLYLRYAEQ